MHFETRESIKALGIVFLVVSIAVFLASVLLPGMRSSTSMSLRAGSIVVFVLSVTAIVAALRQKGEVKDILRETYGSYFECDGICFVIFTEVKEGVCFLKIVFQNRYELAGRCRIILRPTRKNFQMQESVALTLEFGFPEGGIGETFIPIPVKREWAGTRQIMDIVAGVMYPFGRGRTLHYGVATVVLRSRVSFSTPFLTTLSYVALLGGNIFVHQHPNISVDFPKRTAETLPASAKQETVIFWRLGDRIF